MWSRELSHLKFTALTCIGLVGWPVFFLLLRVSIQLLLWIISNTISNHISSCFLTAVLQSRTCWLPSSVHSSKSCMISFLQGPVQISLRQWSPHCWQQTMSWPALNGQSTNSLQDVFGSLGSKLFLYTFTCVHLRENSIANHLKVRASDLHMHWLVRMQRTK